MGVKGLKKLIRKNASGSIIPFDINLLRGAVVVIDSSILLYKYRYLYGSDNFHIIGFNSKIKEFERLGVKPIFIFDGTPPEAKRNVLTKRSNDRVKMKERLEFLQNKTKSSPDNFEEFINSDSESESEALTEIKKMHTEIKKIKKNLLYVNKIHSIEVMELLKSLRIPFFQSPGEAEEYCAFLQKQGVADYILTEDTDCLAFGGSNILFHKNNVYEIINLNLVLCNLKLDYSEFIDLCILCGCDYTCTIPKLGPVSALNIIRKYRSIEKFLESNIKYQIPNSFDFQIARNLFKQNENYINEFNLS